MNNEQYKFDSPAIDGQSIVLVLIVIILALVFGIAALWIRLH